jgi:hypothetical protein
LLKGYVLKFCDSNALALGDTITIEEIES